MLSGFNSWKHLILQRFLINIVLNRYLLLLFPPLPSTFYIDGETARETGLSAHPSQTQGDPGETKLKLEYLTLIFNLHVSVRSSGVQAFLHDVTGNFIQLIIC